MRCAAFALALALTLTGCAEPRTDRGTVAPEAGPSTAIGPSSAVPDAELEVPTATSTPRPSDPTPDPITHPCVVTSVQFDIAFRDGDKSCRSDSDCECIPLRVGDKQACGGVSSKKTGARLRALEKEFAKRGCKSLHKCAQRVCQPQCASGQCQ